MIDSDQFHADIGIASNFCNGVIIIKLLRPSLICMNILDIEDTLGTPVWSDWIQEEHDHYRRLCLPRGHGSAPAAVSRLDDSTFKYSTKNVSVFSSEENSLTVKVLWTVAIMIIYLTSPGIYAVFFGEFEILR